MLRKHTVGSIMSRTLVTLTEEDSLEGVAEGMDLLKFRYLPVVDGDRLVGLVTHANLLRRTGQGLLFPTADATEQQRWQSETFVASVMRRNPYTVGPDTTVAEVAREFLKQDVPCALVVEDERLVGIVTRSDVLKLALTLLEQD